MKSSPARRLPVAALGLWLVSAANAQTTAPTTFTASTELVSVPVVVTDKSGTHIRGLKKEEFMLLEDDKQQPIAIFEEIQAGSVPPPQPAAPSDHFSNVPAASASPQQLTIVMLDMVNTPVPDQIYARRELVNYLREPATAGLRIAVLTLNRTGVRLIQQSNDDPKRLAEALKRVDRSQQPVIEQASEAYLTDAKDKLSTILQGFGEFQVSSEQAALSFDRRQFITLTLESMQQVALVFAGLPGRKNLVWVGGGFPFSINETTMALKEGGAGMDTPANLEPLYEKTWEALNRAQISLYSVDIHGLADLPGPSNGPVKKPLNDPFTHGQWLHANTNGTFQIFAHATAGRAFLNRNGLRKAIQQAVDDSSSYYLLAYYQHHEGKQDGWRKLAVHVNREGAQVMARAGFFLKPVSAKLEDTSKETMQAAIDSPLNYTAISITARWQEIQPAPEKGKKKAIFILTMPANFAEVDQTNRNHFALDFWAAARTPSGKPAGDMEQAMEGYFKPEIYNRFRNKGTDYRGALTVAPGEYIVRFVVRDRLSGRIGSLSAPLKVSP